MRRADRLFRIVQVMRTGRLVTARQLADKMEVSERTIYRDIADLQGSGVPIDGEAGIGYLMRDGYDLPPLMFTRDEVSALIIGARMAAAWSGAKTALASEMALAKIDNVIPEDMRGMATDTPIFALNFSTPDHLRIRFDEINDAIFKRQVLSIDYEAADGSKSEREIEPLSLYYWGKVWTLASWCRLRSDFRTFRLDRMVSVKQSGEIYKNIPGQTLRDYLEKMSREEDCGPPPGTTI